MRTTALNRLTLREFEPRDRDALMAMHRDPRVVELLVDDVPLHDARRAHEFIERIRAYYLANPGLGIWCAERWASVLSEEELADPEVRESLSDEALAQMSRPVPNFAGWFNLMRVTDWPEEIEIGCRLVPQVWGSGIVHDGGESLLDKAFGKLGLSRVWGICHPQHRSVQQVLRTLGFRDDGERACAGVDAKWFVIHAERWAAHRELPRRERMRLSLRASTSRAAG
ncbi:MAG: GNAT family N-acetyltransferase [Burkholderiales bacterium]|nr:GNAT family N-acetyltransferase [Burkholderiales bacterium]